MRTLGIIFLGVLTLGAGLAYYFLVYKKKVVDPETGEKISTESDILIPGTPDVNPVTMATLYPALAAEIASNPVLASQIIADPSLKDKMNARPGKNVIMTTAAGVREGFLTGAFGPYQAPYMIITGTTFNPAASPQINWPGEINIQVGRLAGFKYSEFTYNNVNNSGIPADCYEILYSDEVQPAPATRKLIPKVYAKLI